MPCCRLLLHHHHEDPTLISSWYAHYDGNPSFSDFAAFGGWTHPAIKQYQGTTSLCSAGVDLSWYPDFAVLNASHPHHTRV